MMVLPTKDTVPCVSAVADTPVTISVSPSGLWGGHKSLYHSSCSRGKKVTAPQGIFLALGGAAQGGMDLRALQ
jgi:hypothetical protein